MLIQGPWKPREPVFETPSAQASYQFFASAGIRLLPPAEITAIVQEAIRNLPDRRAYRGCSFSDGFRVGERFILIDKHPDEKVCLLLECDGYDSLAYINVTVPNVPDVG